MLFAETGVCRWWLSPSRGFWCMGQANPGLALRLGWEVATGELREGSQTKHQVPPQPFLSRVSLAAAQTSDLFVLSATHVRMLVFNRMLSRVQSIGKGHGYLGKI